jgi:hypothetical protein
VLRSFVCPNVPIYFREYQLQSSVPNPNQANENALLSNINLLPQFTSQMSSEMQLNEQQQEQLEIKSERQSSISNNDARLTNENEITNYKSNQENGLKLPTQENFDEMKNSFSMEKLNNKSLKRKLTSPNDNANENAIVNKILSNEKKNSQHFSKKPHMTNGINGNKEDSNGNEAYDEDDMLDEDEDEDIQEIDGEEEYDDENEDDEESGEGDEEEEEEDEEDEEDGEDDALELGEGEEKEESDGDELMDQEVESKSEKSKNKKETTNYDEPKSDVLNGEECNNQTVEIETEDESDKGEEEGNCGDEDEESDEEDSEIVEIEEINDERIKEKKEDSENQKPVVFSENNQKICDEKNNSMSDSYQQKKEFVKNITKIISTDYAIKKDPLIESNEKENIVQTDDIKQNGISKVEVEAVAVPLEVNENVQEEKGIIV